APFDGDLLGHVLEAGQGTAVLTHPDEVAGNFAVEDAPIPGHEVHRFGAQAAVAHEFLDDRRPPLGIAPQAQLEGGLADGILDGIAVLFVKEPGDLSVTAPDMYSQPDGLGGDLYH